MSPSATAYGGRHDGSAAVVETLKGQPLLGHITLTKTERSPITVLVTELLDEA
jgi:PhoH-like ATPase